MGSETHLHLRTASQEIIARVHADSKFTAGASIPLHVELDKVHLFDAATDQLL